MRQHNTIDHGVTQCRSYAQLSIVELLCTATAQFNTSASTQNETRISLNTKAHT